MVLILLIFSPHLIFTLLVIFTKPFEYHLQYIPPFPAPVYPIQNSITKIDNLFIIRIEPEFAKIRYLGKFHWRLQ